MKKRSTTRKNKSVLPWQAIVLFLVILLGGVYLLIPDDKDLIQRYLDAGQPEKVIEYLGNNPDLDPVSASLAKMDAIGRIAVERKHPELWREAFHIGVEEYVKLGAPAELLEPIMGTTPYLLDPLEAARWAGGALESLDSQASDPIYRALMREVLADGDSSIAAGLYRELLPKDSMTSQQLAELLRLRRLAGQNEIALQDLNDLAPLVKRGEDVQFDLLLEEASLLQSLNRVEESFDQLFVYWQDHPQVVSNTRFFELIRGLSIAADRQEDVVPIMKERLRVEPDDPALFSDYLDLNLALASVDEAERALEQKRASGMLTPSQARTLAKIREWGGKPGDAFDEYRRLALEGDEDALERLFVLNEGLYRHYELAEILAEYSGGKSDEVLLREARLLARIGEYERSVDTFDTLLNGRKDAVPVWYAEMADVALTIHDFPAAVHALRMAVSLKPTREQEIRWKKDIGWILSLEGKYEMALGAYAAVYLDYGEEDVLPSIVSLSTLIGDRVLYRWTLEEIVQRNAADSPDASAEAKLFRQKVFGADRRWRAALNQYTRSLAQIYADEGRYEESARIISQHSEVFSQEEIFGFYLNVLAEDQQFEEGAGALEEAGLAPELLQNMNTARTAIWILESSGRQKKALDLAEELHEHFPEDANTGLTVARLLAGTGRTQEARELLKQYDREDASPEVLLLSSEVASASGRFAQAEAMLMRYLDQKEEPDARDITRLGDLRLAAGDQDGAKESYRDAVQVLLKEAGGLE